MQRLLQGDVGSGKTIVAALAMLHAAEAGYQAALMAPTEIPPSSTISSWPTGCRRSASRWPGLRQPEKTRAARWQELLASGEAMLAVAPTPLIEDPVAFPRLGLAVVDEQHCFGVRQRLSLREKGSRAASAHADDVGDADPAHAGDELLRRSDVSVLDELPPGRTPIVTPAGVRMCVARRSSAGCATPVCRPPGLLGVPADRGVRGAAAADRQETFATLVGVAGARVGLLHGRMKPAEKARHHGRLLRRANCSLLVATTVIEVGWMCPTPA